MGPDAAIRQREENLGGLGCGATIVCGLLFVAGLFVQGWRSAPLFYIATGIAVLALVVMWRWLIHRSNIPEVKRIRERYEEICREWPSIVVILKQVSVAPEAFVPARLPRDSGAGER